MEFQFSLVRGTWLSVPVTPSSSHGSIEPFPESNGGKCSLVGKAYPPLIGGACCGLMLARAHCCTGQCRTCASWLAGEENVLLFGTESKMISRSGQHGWPVSPCVLLRD